MTIFSLNHVHLLVAYFVRMLQSLVLETMVSVLRTQVGQMER